MKRDFDIIRLLLIEKETEEQSEELKKYPEKEILYNAKLAIDAGLIEGEALEGGDCEIVSAVLIRLTWQGHDFLDASRDETIWKKAREKFMKPAVRDFSM